jgi:CO/xanthine dehydrogenase Mo-binding subunit
VCVCVCASQVIFRAGAHLDLAMNDGAALVGASDSAYDLSGLSVEVRLARCNLPPHTIMRGPGYLQGCMFMEQVGALFMG